MPRLSKKLIDETLLYAEVRKKITSPYHLTQLQIIARRWGNVKIQDVCWRLIVQGIERERETPTR